MSPTNQTNVRNLSARKSAMPHTLIRKGHNMATAGERINALENSITAMMQMMQSMAGATNAQADDDGDDDTDVVTVSDTVRTGKAAASKAATPKVANGRRGKAAAAPAATVSAKERDRDARCTINQAQYAAYCARSFTGLAKRISKTGTTYYAGVKREKFSPATEKAYNAHVESAIQHLLAAFNLYAGDDAVDTDSATYGDLWDWLNDNAPVSASKAAR